MNTQLIINWNTIKYVHYICCTHYIIDKNLLILITKTKHNLTTHPNTV